MKMKEWKDRYTIADTICGFARSTMLHSGYSGWMAAAVNLAFPYSLSLPEKITTA